MTSPFHSGAVLAQGTLSNPFVMLRAEFHPNAIQDETNSSLFPAPLLFFGWPLVTPQKSPSSGVFPFEFDIMPREAGSPAAISVLKIVLGAAADYVRPIGRNWMLPFGPLLRGDYFRRGSKAKQGDREFFKFFARTRRNCGTGHYPALQPPELLSSA
jgi:hypothetical protein